MELTAAIHKIGLRGLNTRMTELVHCNICVINQLSAPLEIII